MLVLSRKINEEIVIGNNVSIKIVGVAGNKVRLGISAPDCITILRRELDPLATPVGHSPHTSSARPMPALCR